MNTPAHTTASVFLWRKEPGWGSAVAVSLGAVLPDAPMFGFYAYQKLIAGSTKADIWSTLYFQDNWQLFFDVFNSAPILLVVAAVCHYLGYRWGVLLALSALLHVCCDLPLHHDDGHRHFLPFTNWRFVSPVSYWDPKHFGGILRWVELAFGVGASAYVSWKGEHASMRYVARATLGLYLLGITIAVIYWIANAV